ncbi:MAG: hypothetical protein RLZZ144_952 [Pseudomonadota bacterium]|jgi:cytochrome b561
MEKYSNRLVIVHWLTLVLLVVSWFLGDSLDEARENGGATIAAYVTHAAIGASVMLLTLMRLAFRRQDGVPTALGNTPMDKMAKGIQHFLYLVLVLIPFSGVMQVLGSAVGKAIIAGDAALLPSKFNGLFAHEAHGVLVNVLIVLVLIHLLGALKHQFVLKDGIMNRMSLRNKK